MKRLRLSFFLFFLAAPLIYGASPALATWRVSPEGVLQRDVEGEVLSDQDPASPSGEIHPLPIQVRIESNQGQFNLKVESDDGTELERLAPEGAELLRISQRSEENEIHLRSDSAHRLLVSRHFITARTELPLSVNLRTNQLVVESQSGSQVVALLPDQVLARLFHDRILDRVGALSVNEILSQAGLAADESRRASPSAALAESIELKVDQAGQPVYEIRGAKKLSFLGFLPVVLPRTVLVSAQTGAVEKVTESALTRFVSLISL